MGTEDLVDINPNHEALAAQMIRLGKPHVVPTETLHNLFSQMYCYAIQSHLYSWKDKWMLYAKWPATCIRGGTAM